MSENTDVAGPTPYVVKQYVFDGRGERNEEVADLEGLVTHHPRANQNARMVDGRFQHVERPTRRSHAFIGGEFQEVEMPRTDEYRSLDADQVLLVKDFILENAQGRRRLDVPSPLAGYVGRVDAPNGLVEIREGRDGDVIARIRHLSPISVQPGDQVAYGQALGTQGNAGLNLPPGRNLHVHLEMDTRYYQHMDAYMRDLASGRLPMEAAHRQQVPPPVISDDGVQRLGERGGAVYEMQRALRAEGYRGSDGREVEIDGVYRSVLQGAVVAFQQDHGLRQSGDIDISTQQSAASINRALPLGPAPAGSGAVPEDPARTGRRPESHAHDAEPSAAHPSQAGAFMRHKHPMYEQAVRAVHTLDARLGRVPDDASERMAASLLRLARDNGFHRIDHVVLGRQTGHAAAGQNVFIVQGGLDDAGARVAHMPTEQAVRTPVEQSFRTLEAPEHDRTVALAQQPELDAQAHSAPVLQRA